MVKEVLGLRARTGIWGWSSVFGAQGRLRQLIARDPELTLAEIESRLRLDRTVTAIVRC